MKRRPISVVAALGPRNLAIPFLILTTLGLLGASRSAANAAAVESSLYDVSDVIVYGTVAHVSAQSGPNGGDTRVAVIAVREILKGGVATDLVVRETAGGSGPEYSAGTDVVVFARSLPSGEFQTAGGRAGHFEVWTDARGELFAAGGVWREASAIAAEGPQSARRSRPVARTGEDGLVPFDEFMTFLRNGASGKLTKARPEGGLDPVMVFALTAEDAAATAGTPVETLAAAGAKTGLVEALASGYVRGAPNPIQVCDGSGLGVTRIEWSYSGKSVEIHVSSPTGKLFARGGSSGSALTGKWVTNGTKFYAVDRRHGTVLGYTTVGLTTSGCTAPAPSPTPTPVPSPTPTPVPSPSPTPTPVPPPPTGSYPPAQTVTSRPPQITMAKPSYLGASAIPGLSTKVMRLTEATTFGGGRRMYRHFYSKRQPWNSDGSLLLLAYENTAYLLNGNTYQRIKSFTPWSEPVWSNTDPDILYGVTSNPGGLVEYRVSTASYRIVQTFTGWNSASIGVGEGNLSADGRLVALVGTTATGVEVLVYDIPNQRIVSRKTFGPMTLGVDLDWASISPSGRYVVVCHNNVTNRGHDIYDAQTMTLLRRVTNGYAAHADIGYDAAGNEVLVTQNGSTALVTIRLSDGYQRQELTSTQMAANQHVSCRNTARPGYCYVSTYSDIWGYDQYLYREIFAVKLDGSGQIERFAQNFSAPLPVADLDYVRQAHAVPSRDGSRLLFASDWGNGTSSAIIDAYVVGVGVGQ